MQTKQNKGYNGQCPEREVEYFVSLLDDGLNAGKTRPPVKKTQKAKRGNGHNGHRESVDAAYLISLLDDDQE
jgi:hypothetical protein